MKMEGTGLEGITIDLARLDEIMDDLGLVRAGQWDYERATYDRKIEAKGDIYYLRVPAYAVEGDVGGRHAVMKLITPLLGKHYYPHGVEYGEGEEFPSAVVDTSKSLLKRLSEELKKVQ
ncbi:YugN-like family protein [Metabacillus litoralis]|uniref:YugN family protein n=1 Tax=Metabacillus TaxID=2675233 RepID=UPI001BA39486|nr:YugN family protein [Metabacillus litoralis]MCM3160367.1 YugN-like family protein [Metabacillus litoralis]UHA59409.1 YugN-like family protein [Metabacillus litoralis]